MAVYIFPHNKYFRSTHLHETHSFVNSVAILSSVDRDLLKVTVDKFFLVYELDPAHHILRQINGLVEPVFTAVRDIHDFDNLRLQPLDNTITLHEGRTLEQDT